METKPTRHCLKAGSVGTHAIAWFEFTRLIPSSTCRFNTAAFSTLIVRSSTGRPQSAMWKSS